VEPRLARKKRRVYDRKSRGFKDFSNLVSCYSVGVLICPMADSSTLIILAEDTGKFLEGIWFHQEFLGSICSL
jgi:hypothetical protein